MEMSDLSEQEPRRLQKMKDVLWGIFSYTSPITAGCGYTDSPLTDEQEKALRALGY